MFGKSSGQSRNERADGHPDISGRISVISKDVCVLGDLTSRHSLQIHGKVFGDVTAGRVELSSTGSVEGDVIAAGSSDKDQTFLIDGPVHGRVHAPHVEVGPNGAVAGGVIADTAVIHGRVLRGVVVRKHLALGEASVVVGDVSAPQLSVMEGGDIKGTIRTGTPAGDTLNRAAAAIAPEVVAAAYFEVERESFAGGSPKPMLTVSEEPAA